MRKLYYAIGILVAATFLTSIATNDASAASWTALPNTGTHSATPSGVQIQIAPNGTPYIAYRAGSSTQILVKSYDGSAWNDVGSPIGTLSNRDFVLKISPSNEPYVTSFVDNNGYTAARTVRYSGGAWSQVGNLINREVGTWNSYNVESNADLTFNATGVPYVSVVYSNESNSESKNIRLFSLSGGTWSQVGSTLNPPGSISPAIIPGMFVRLNSTGTPYLAFAYACSSPGSWETIYCVGVYNQVGTSWQQLSHSAYSILGINGFEITPNNTLYLGYMSNLSGDVGFQVSKSTGGAFSRLSTGLSDDSHLSAIGVDASNNLYIVRINNGSVPTLSVYNNAGTNTVYHTGTAAPSGTFLGGFDVSADGKPYRAYASSPGNTAGAMLYSESGPTDITLSASSIAENTATSTAVGTLSTTDPTSGDTFTYSLVSGTGSTDNSSFTITGNALHFASSPNYETKNSYSIRIRTTDASNETYEKAFTITVTNVNEAPTDIELSSNSLAENNAANATIGTLSATDPDASSTFTYSLVAGAGDADNSAFNISGTNLRLTGSADYETKNTYQVRVQVSDGNLTYQKAFTISITNVNEAPTDIALSASSVAENTPTATAVGTLSATDPDASSSFTYSLVTGTGSETMPTLVSAAPHSVLRRLLITNLHTMQIPTIATKFASKSVTAV